MKTGDELALTIESLAFGGDAVAHAPDGRAVFVAGGGVPGDQVRARLVEVKKRFARATLIEVTAAGATRVEARCPLVPVCGGCQWQEVSLDAQRGAKQAIVERALSRLGAEVRPISGTRPFQYRSRARFTVGEAGAIGYQGRRSHAVVDVPSCPLLEPPLDAAMTAAARELRSWLRSGASLSGLVGVAGRVHLAIRSIDAGEAGRAGKAGGAGKAGMDPRATGTGLRDAAAALVGRHGIVGVVLDGERHGEAALDCGGLDEAAAEPPFLAAADGFAQASHHGNRALRATVAAEVQPAGASVLELYAGDGNFTRDLAASAAAIVAVESEASACERLRHNLRATLDARGSLNDSSTAASTLALTVVTGDAAEAVRRLVGEGARFDVVLLDPPRTGAAEVVSLLGALTSRVVYVSCDPMTLARDAATLAAAGLVPVRAWPLDLMPQTYHVEIVCVFERDGARPGTPHAG